VIGIRTRIPVTFAVATLIMGACDPSPALRAQSTFSALANHPAGRVPRALLPSNWATRMAPWVRAPTWCEAYYEDARAQWVRRADGTVVRAGRGWLLAPEDSIGWRSLASR
jgi:hypothetical protein